MRSAWSARDLSQSSALPTNTDPQTGNDILLCLLCIFFCTPQQGGRLPATVCVWGGGGDAPPAEIDCVLEVVLIT